MTGLSSELYNRCRSTLLRCREFENYRTLKAVFVTEPLSPFRIGLPQADNSESLVDLCLDHLVFKRLSNGQPVLPIFIATIRDRYGVGDELRDDLAILSDEIERAMSTKPDISFAKEQEGPTEFSWNSASVRELLKAAFTDDELNNMCFDYFQPVYNTFAAGMSKTQKIQSLLEYCIRHSQLEKLLSLVRENNPAQYARYKNRLRDRG
mgnify:CR=1 FL=1